MILGSGEMMEGKEKLLARDYPQIRLHTAFEPNARLGVPMSGDLGDSFHGSEPIHDWARLRGSHQEVEIPHSLHASTEASGSLDPLNLGQIFEPGKNPVGHFTGFPPKVSGGVSLTVLDPGKNLFLGLFAKALQLSDFSIEANPVQGFDGINLELLVQNLDFLTSQSRDIQKIHQSRRDRGDQFVIKFQLSGGMQSLDLFGQGLPNPLDIAQPALLNDLAKVFLHGLQGTGSAKISPYLKRVLSLDFHHRSDAFQNLHDILFIHKR